MALPPPDHLADPRNARADRSIGAARIAEARVRRAEAEARDHADLTPMFIPDEPSPWVLIPLLFGLILLAGGAGYALRVLTETPIPFP